VEKEKGGENSYLREFKLEREPEKSAVRGQGKEISSASMSSGKKALTKKLEMASLDARRGEC